MWITFWDYRRRQLTLGPVKVSRGCDLLVPSWEKLIPVVIETFEIIQMRCHP